MGQADVQKFMLRPWVSGWADGQIGVISQVPALCFGVHSSALTSGQVTFMKPWTDSMKILVPCEREEQYLPGRGDQTEDILCFPYFVVPSSVSVNPSD